MKLKKLTTEGFVKYWENDCEIDLPEYKFKEDEVRGIWVSNVVNIDTPLLTTIDEYKAYLDNMINVISSYNLNTIIFQVRPNCDAYYPSILNPWSRYITGIEGKDPGFDVFQYVIDRAKEKNIKVHAWMNPYRVSQASLDTLKLTKEEYLDTLAENNYARIHKEDTILDGINKVILSPSHETVIKFVTDSIMEVINNYDIEGVHIDDYFYPYSKIPDEFEKDDYLKYRTNENQSLDDFRRMNVDKMIKSVHDAIAEFTKNSGRKVLFGISPFAIYRAHTSIREDGWEKGSYHSAGALQCYSELYSDVYKWMKENWIDYVVPQVYFPFERKDVTYHDLTKWWSNIAKETGTVLYIGQGLYQMGSNEFWQNTEEINNQLRFNQNFDNVQGTIFFTYHDLLKTDNQIKNESIDLLKKLWNK